jgi:hypothetical protein
MNGNRCFRCAFTSSKVMVINCRFAIIQIGLTHACTPQRHSNCVFNVINAGAGSCPGRAEENGHQEQDAGVTNQPGDAKADVLGHLHRLTFVMKLEGVIALGRFQRGAEKDETVVGEMMRQHFNKGRGSSKCSASMAAIIP